MLMVRGWVGLEGVVVVVQDVWMVAVVVVDVVLSIIIWRGGRGERKHNNKQISAFYLNFNIKLVRTCNGWIIWWWCRRVSLGRSLLVLFSIFLLFCCMFLHEFSNKLGSLFIMKLLLHIHNFLKK